MVEWHGGFLAGDSAVNAKVMATFELAPNGKIAQMREYFDVKSLIDQRADAGFHVPQ